MNNLETSLPMPITNRAIQTARQFAASVLNQQESQQIYLNTLAVWAVHDYLQLMEIDTDLAQSDSWHPVLRICVDVADLMVTGLGKLECRPVSLSNLENQEVWLNQLNESKSLTINSCCIPPEVWDDRIGYVVVEINQQRQEARLLGFAKTAGDEELILSELEPMDALLLYLEELTKNSKKAANSSLTNLGQWLLSVFECGWQDIELLFDTPSEIETQNSDNSHSRLGQGLQNILDKSRQAVVDFFDFTSNSQLPESLNFREPESVESSSQKARTILFPTADVTRAKLLDFGMQLGTKAIALLVALTQESNQKINIFVQVHPINDAIYLPPQLQLALLSESGETLQTVESRSQDICLQLLSFKVLPGTQFSIQVTLDNLSIKEAFAI